LPKISPSAFAPIELAGSVVFGSPTITGLSETFNITVGDYVSGLAGIPAGTRVIDVPSTTTVTMDNNATVGGSGTVSFSSLEVTRSGTSIVRSGDLVVDSFEVTNVITSGLTIGDAVSGTGIQSDTIISRIVNATTLIISLKAEAPAGTQSLTFTSNQLYTYAFYYYYKYFIGTEEFEDLGATTVVQVAEAFEPEVLAMHIDKIPPMGNGKKGWPLPADQTIENYELSEIKVRIHRSLLSQSTLFFLREFDHNVTYQTCTTNGTTSITDLQTTAGLLPGDIINGDTIATNSVIVTVDSATAITVDQAAGSGSGNNCQITIVDSVPDDDISNNVILYTDSGVYDNDPPPPAKFVSVVNDIAWYGHVKEGDEIFTSRVRQSIKFDIDSCPGSFSIEVEDEVTGLGSVQIYPIIGCKNHIFRLEGVHDELGRGYIDKREISRATGLVSHNSIVNTIDGMFFAGNDGFYYCDAYRVVKISDEINDTYRLITATETQKKNIYGIFYEKEQQVWWSCQIDPTAPDNDSVIVFHVREGIKRDGVFTIQDGSDSFAPTSLLHFEGDIIRTDRRGYVFKFDDTIFDDPKVDTAVDPSDWTRQAIIYDYRSPVFDFGTASHRKWVSSIIFNAQNITNVSVGISSNNNDSGKFQDLKEIRIDDNIVWGTPGLLWNDTEIIYRWNNTNLIDQQRRFPARSLRCSYKQVRFTNSFTNIAKSDALGLADVDATVKTATLLGGENWPTESVDYFISFEEDDYTENYLITDVTPTVVTYSDVGDATQDRTNHKWVIRGYRKGDALSLIGYAMHYTSISPTQVQFKGDLGANA